jgi:hypothetical protein
MVEPVPSIPPKGNQNMASFFVASIPQPDGTHAVHDRSRCPPRCFPREGASEYLGEFFEGAQAVAVARLRYAHAHGCTFAVAAMPLPVDGPVPAYLPVLTALRT